MDGFKNTKTEDLQKEHDCFEEMINKGDEGIPKDVLEEVEKELEELLKDFPKGLGFCHVYWNYKKELLLKRGYEWLSPKDIADSDPHQITFFD